MTRPQDVTELNSEQRAAMHPKITVVEAGPGTGKTRTVVARFVQSQAEAGGRGVALLSFTNAATDEARSRATHPGALRPPNFVGTIDTFLHRFVVTPHLHWTEGLEPKYVDAWDNIPIRPKAGVGVRLSSFEWRGDGDIRLREAALDPRERAYVSSLSPGDHRRLLTSAVTRLKGLRKRGWLDADTARRIAGKTIEHCEDLAPRIARRFVELIVDEAQDCDASEMAVLQRLAEHTRVVLVADPDQAIFEFRGASPAVFARYRDDQAVEARTALTVNYRSTPTITAFVDDLRSAADIHVTSNTTERLPLLLIGAEANRQRSVFLTALEKAGIPIEKAAVLAHARSAARKVAGTEASPTTTSSVVRLAQACRTLRALDASAATRLDAITTAEGVLLRVLLKPDARSGRLDRREALERLGLDSSSIRVLASQTLSVIGDPSDRDACARELKAAVQQVVDLMGGSAMRAATLMRRPTDKQWAGLGRADEPTRLQAMTVHESKGREFEAVLVVVSGTRTDGLDAWEAGANAEARRVLYVAASRARRLLAIAAGGNVDKVRGLLERAGLDFAEP